MYWVPSPAMPEFFNGVLQKKSTNYTLSQGKVICSDHRLLWRDSFRGVDCVRQHKMSLYCTILLLLLSLLSNEPS